MEEWTSHNTNPSNIWKSLKKDNPNLDEQFFRLPNGGWDITRLNQAINEKNELSQKMKQEESKRLAQTTFAEEQRKTLTRIKKKNANEAAKSARIKSSKKVEFDTFRIGMGMFLIPAFIQLVILLSISAYNPLVALVKLIDAIPILVFLNLVMWISIPVMTNSLAKQINKLDYRTRNLE